MPHHRQSAWCVLIVEPATPTGSLPPECLTALSAHGLTHLQVTSAAAAVEMLRKEHPRLILLDPDVPGSHGVEAFGQIHRAAAGVPIIVLVRPEQLLLGGDCLALGAVDYLVRGSFDARKLLKRIRREIHHAETTEQARADAQMLRALLASLPDRIYVKDRDSRFLRGSTALAQAFGLADPADLVGRTDFDFFERDEATRRRLDEQAVMQSGNPLVGRIEPETSSEGRVTWSHTSKVAYRSPEGRIIGTIGITRDITDLKVMELALERERNLLRSLIDALPYSIFAKDTQSRFIAANRSVAQLMGCAQPEDLIGKTDFDFYPEPAARAYFDDEQEVLRTGQPLIDRAERVPLPGGEVRLYLSSKLPFYDSTGSPAGIMGIGRDVTAWQESGWVLPADRRSD